MSGDPNEYVWQRYYASLLQQFEPDEARRRADKALAEHCERWPRDREVLTVQQHQMKLDEQVKYARENALQSVRSIIESAAEELRNRHADCQYARDCLFAVLEAIKKSYAGIPTDRLFAMWPYIPTVLPDRRVNADDEAKIRKLLRLTDYAEMDVHTIADWLEQRMREEFERGTEAGHAAHPHHVEGAAPGPYKCVDCGRQVNLLQDGKIVPMKTWRDAP